MYPVDVRIKKNNLELIFQSGKSFSEIYSIEREREEIKAIFVRHSCSGGKYAINEETHKRLLKRLKSLS